MNSETNYGDSSNNLPNNRSLLSVYLNNEQPRINSTTGNDTDMGNTPLTNQNLSAPILDFQNLDSNTTENVEGESNIVPTEGNGSSTVPGNTQSNELPIVLSSFQTFQIAVAYFLRSVDMTIKYDPQAMTNQDIDLIRLFQQKLRERVLIILQNVERNRIKVTREINENQQKLQQICADGRQRHFTYLAKIQKMKMRAVEMEAVEIQNTRKRISEYVKTYKIAIADYSKAKINNPHLPNPTQSFISWFETTDVTENNKYTEGLEALRNYMSQVIENLQLDSWIDENRNYNTVVRNMAVINKGNLNSEIQWVFPLHKLPSEILHLVLDRLSPRTSIVNLLTVCKLWALIIVKFLYYRPHISKKSQLDLFLRTMKKPPGEMMFDYRLMIKRLNFSFVGDHIHDKELYYFVGCHNLERLTLVFCKHITSGPVAAVLHNCKFLQSVDITGIKDVQDNVFNMLSESCPRVQGFYVPNAKNVTLPTLNNFILHAPILKRVKITGNVNLNDNIVSLMAEKCPLLVEVDITGSPNVHDESLIKLFLKLPQLREFRITNNENITDKLFTELAKNVDQLPALRLVDFSSCENITDKTIEKLVTLAPKLRNIFLGKCSRITDNSLYSLAQLGKNLQTVHFGHFFNITDQGVRVLVQSCPRIQYVDFACCNNLTNRTLYELSDLNKLKRSGLVKCSQMTDEGLLNMISLRGRNDCLERVHLSYCSNLTIYPIYELLMACPRLSHLSLTAVPSFLRPDITAFCRPAPSDFSDNQRQIFCVFSGKGVHKLRHYLMSLTAPTNSPQTDINDVLTKYVVSNNLLQPSESLSDGIERISSDLNQDSAAILAASGVTQLGGLNTDINYQNIPFQGINDIFTWSKEDLDGYALSSVETSDLMCLIDRRFYEEPFLPEFEEVDPDVAPGATTVTNSEVCHIIRKFHELDERLEDFEVNVASLSRVQFQFTGFLLHEMTQLYVIMVELNRQTFQLQERVFSSQVEKDKKGFYVWRILYIDRFAELLQRYKIATIVLRLYLKDSVTLLTRQREAALASNRIPALGDEISMNDRSATTISNNNDATAADSDEDMGVDDDDEVNVIAPGNTDQLDTEMQPDRVVAPFTAGRFRTRSFGFQDPLDLHEMTDAAGNGRTGADTNQTSDSNGR
ncbi:SCF ubiquitin ligase complex subunit [Maudiozyma exigua]|uniref:SCF ubiquitin ligase complex subunit n=1 Tax=Maudiozyma exigua TaxID=34358 RepID=A0A9P6WFC6_MAUEX|nr:SCF ubiquitin ligase complex subunit [Kazachstania exigua]